MDSDAICNRPNEEDVESNSVLQTQAERQDDSIPCVNLQPQPNDVSLKTFPFLKLPPEIRNLVYGCPVTWRANAARLITWFFSGLRQPAITRVNRQLRLETLEFFYGNHVFYLGLPPLAREYDENTPQRRDPFNFISRALDPFTPRPTSTLTTRNLSFLSTMELGIKTGKVWPAVDGLWLTMSREDPEWYEEDETLMRTDGLNWNDEEEVAEAFLETMRSSELINLAALVRGNDDVFRGAVGPSSEIARILCLVARHCPQLTSSVVIAFPLEDKLYTEVELALIPSDSEDGFESEDGLGTDDGSESV